MHNKTIWVDGVTNLSAQNLNNIENGIVKNEVKTIIPNPTIKTGDDVVKNLLKWNKDQSYFEKDEGGMPYDGADIVQLGKFYSVGAFSVSDIGYRLYRQEDGTISTTSYSDCAKNNHLPANGRIPQATKILLANFNKQLKVRYGDGAELILTRQVYSSKNPGYRCAKQNKRVGGASNSSHLRANAFDYMARIDGEVQKGSTFYKKLQKQFHEFNPFGGRSINYTGNGHADVEYPRTW